MLTMSFLPVDVDGGVRTLNVQGTVKGYQLNKGVLKLVCSLKHQIFVDTEKLSEQSRAAPKCCKLDTTSNSQPSMD